jgi:CRISPR-associated protein Cmr2
MTSTPTPTPIKQIQVAIAWCLAWNQPQGNRDRATTLHNQPCDPDLQSIIEAVRQLRNLKQPETIEQLKQYTQDYTLLWEGRVGLVYGGATKIKPYVFDIPKLHEIRGASALLDNINLVDLPAFFHADETEEDRFKPCRNAGTGYCDRVREWLTQESYGALVEGLIPELIIYSTGGNILAFCPPNLVDTLADAIEKRYTTETLTANSCAVGATFRPLEMQFGLLPEAITDDMFWLEKCQQSSHDELVQAYIKVEPNFSSADLETKFADRKSFNELTSKLAILFNQRRAGNNVSGRSTTRRYSVMLETQPYLQRDNTAKGIAALRAEDLPNKPWHSESSARKRIIGQIAKRDNANQAWYQPLRSRWNPNPKAESWVKRFEDYLSVRPAERTQYCGQNPPNKVFEAQTVGEIGNASDKFIAYIYADGNNMGGYIQTIRDPEKYRQFSEDISKITEESVYESLARHLTVHRLQRQTDPEKYHQDGEWIHPFEIITIGGDDVFLIVPADRALQIAKSIGDIFEHKLSQPSMKGRYSVLSDRPSHLIHRYQPENAEPAVSKLSMSIGVLITSEDTPIAYAESLTEQLLKSAKEKAKYLKQPCEYDGVVYKKGYHGGTIDFQVLKSVTMISSKISEFRKDGLVVNYEDSPSSTGEKPKDLHLYSTPYTLHEIGGLISLIEGLKGGDFPRSQLYQFRSFLEKGRRTAILNYRYFQVRLKRNPHDLQQLLVKLFEESWCSAKENKGNLAPWMYYAELPDPSRPSKKKLNLYYETIWRELVDLYEFIPVPEHISTETKAPANTVEGVR